MDILVAERVFVLVEPTGELRPVRLAIHRPEQVSHRTWSCAARLEGLFDGRKDTVGVDSWQALTVACAIVEQALRQHLARGARLRDEEGQELGLDDFFPRFP